MNYKSIYYSTTDRYKCCQANIRETKHINNFDLFFKTPENVFLL